LAGDIDIGYDKELEYLKRLSGEHEKPIFFVLGNHTFYNKGNIDDIRNKWRDEWDNNIDNYNIIYLDEGLDYSIDDTLFVGGILWTDFNNSEEKIKVLAGQKMNDFYQTLMNKGEPFTPTRSIEEHYKIKQSIKESIQTKEDNINKVVVISHHLPSLRSVDMRRYGDSDINYAYYSNLEKYMEELPINVWVHGHTHGSKNYMLGDTRVVCNPRGYYNYEENIDFNQELLIEV
jgi:Icc-related predicted phosphoesterase